MVSIFKVLAPLLFFLNTNGASKLPVLTTKQDIKNIRFISSDGKFTYYQRGNGSLQFSTNYEVKEVIKLKPQTHFNLLVTNDKKYILVEAFEDFHNYLASRANGKIYLLKYGTSDIQEVGEGKIIGLHLKDQWFSYYNSFKHELTLQSTLSSTLKHTIKLANIKNPYFSPQVIMVDTDTILYTDINKDGIPGILRYKLNAGKVNLVYKADSINTALEMCFSQSGYLMSYGLDPLNKGTKIFEIDTKAYQVKENPLYQSPENDIGSLICEFENESLYFIKTTRQSDGKITFDATEFSLESKKEKTLSDIFFASTLLKMDEMLLLPYQDKFYILKGKNVFTETDRLLKLDDTKDAL